MQARSWRRRVPIEGGYAWLLGETRGAASDADFALHVSVVTAPAVRGAPGRAYAATLSANAIAARQPLVGLGVDFADFAGRYEAALDGRRACELAPAIGSRPLELTLELLNEDGLRVCDVLPLGFVDEVVAVAMDVLRALDNGGRVGQGIESSQDESPRVAHDISHARHRPPQISMRCATKLRRHHCARPRAQAAAAAILLPHQIEAGPVTNR